MGSGSSFSVNAILITSVSNANDFLFAGKAKNLTDEITTYSF